MFLNIECTDIPDAWFQSIYNLTNCKNRYIVEKGSFEGETRIEFDFVQILIKYPYQEPWEKMLPQIPSHMSIPNPVSQEYIYQYIPKLMVNDKQPNEDYTYGERINDQMIYWIDELRKNANTNQAILQVGSPTDYRLDDPPCLRHIDMRIKDNTLNFFPYFRSWDLWSGFPANLAGISVLQKYMAGEIGVEPGFILATSKGLHCYGYVEELMKIRTNILRDS